MVLAVQCEIDEKAETVDEEPQEVVVRQFESEGAEMALFEFEGRLKNQVLGDLRQGYLATGQYVPGERAVSPQGVLSMVVASAGTGGIAVSAAMSGKLFMATANPATLMQMKGGYGAAVMGATGIVRQAPFIPVPASMPIVAPLMAMQVMTTVVMLHQFKQVNKKLDAIKATLDEVIARAEATHVGELIAASATVDEIYTQYGDSGIFSTDMLMRLALAERDVRRLTERYEFLLSTRPVSDIKDLQTAQRQNYDAYAAMLASFLDLRVAHLRVCVNLQENPKSVGASLSRLRDELDEDIELWQKILHRSEELKLIIDDREQELKGANFVGRARGDKQLSEMKEAFAQLLQSEKRIMEGFDSLIQEAKRSAKKLEKKAAIEGDTPTLLYWEDEAGAHSIATDEKLIG